MILPKGVEYLLFKVTILLHFRTMAFYLSYLTVVLLLLLHIIRIALFDLNTVNKSKWVHGSINGLEIRIKGTESCHAILSSNAYLFGYLFAQFSIPFKCSEE